MKKFIYIFILLAGFQFAQGQQIALTFFYNSEAPQYSSLLDSLPLTIPSGATGNINIPLWIFMINNGDESINVGDTLFLRLVFNEEEPVYKGFILNKEIKVDSIASFLTSCVIPISAVEAGEYANTLCVDVVSITYNGVFTTISKPADCSVMTITQESNIADIDNLKDVIVYPNPVSDQLKINNLTEATDINIYSITGQLIKTVSAATGTVDIDVTNLSNGIYVVKMQSGKNTRTEKIQVVR